MSSIVARVVSLCMCAHFAVRAEVDIPAEDKEEVFVRRHTKRLPKGQETKSVEPEVWEQFVRHENPTKAKKRLEDGVAEGVMLEVFIAIIGFTFMLGIQNMLRRKGRPWHSQTRARTKAAAGRSDASISGGATIDGRRLPCEDQNDVVMPPLAATPQPCDTNDAKRESRPYVSTDADLLKKLARAVSSQRVGDVARFLDVSLRAIEGANLPQASPKVITETVKTVLRSCVAMRCFDEAIAVYDRLQNRIGLGSRQLWSLLLYIGTEAAAHDRCEEFYWKLRAAVGDAGPSGRDLVNIIRKHAKQNDLSGLRVVLDDLKGLPSNDQFDRLIRNRALAACYKDGATELAECIASSSVFSAPLDIVAFNTLITCYSKAGQYEKCFATFEGMEANGVVPTQATFGSLMDACVGAQDCERARTFFNKLPSYGIPINAQHCTILIKGLVKQKRLGEAEKLLQDMPNAVGMQLDVVAFYTLLRAYTDEGGTDGAERVYSEMLRQGVQPDEFCCNALIHSCTVTKTSAEYVNSILERSIAAGVQPSGTTLSLMLKAFALSSDFDAGLVLLKTSVERFGMSKTEPRLFVQFAQAAIKVGEKEKARELHDVMVKALSASGMDSYKASSRWLLRQCERP